MIFLQGVIFLYNITISIICEFFLFDLQVGQRPNLAHLRRTLTAKEAAALGSSQPVCFCKYYRDCMMMSYVKVLDAWVR